MEQVYLLIVILKYCYKYDEYVIDEGKVVIVFGKIIEQVKLILLEFVGYGFLSYDLDIKVVCVMLKVDVFINVCLGKKDYDNLIFVFDFCLKKFEGYMDEQMKDNLYFQDMVKKYEK